MDKKIQINALEAHYDGYSTLLTKPQGFQACLTGDETAPLMYGNVVVTFNMKGKANTTLHFKRFSDDLDEKDSGKLTLEQDRVGVIHLKDMFFDSILLDDNFDNTVVFVYFSGYKVFKPQQGKKLYNNYLVNNAVYQNNSGVDVSKPIYTLTKYINHVTIINNFYSLLKQTGVTPTVDPMESFTGNPALVFPADMMVYEPMYLKNFFYKVQNTQQLTKPITVYIGKFRQSHGQLAGSNNQYEELAKFKIPAFAQVNSNGMWQSANNDFTKDAQGNFKQLVLGDMICVFMKNDDTTVTSQFAGFNLHMQFFKQ